MKKLDIILGIILGEAVAWYFLLSIKELGVFAGKIGMSPASIYWLLPISFPILTIIALWIASILGKKFLIILQFSKFFLTGTGITLVDLGVLNVLMWIFKIYAGKWFSVFKFISGIVALMVKFLPAKLWVFEKSEKGKQKQEFGGFIIVGIVGLLINVAIASFIVKINPMFGFSKESWANVGAIGAAFIGLAWNFFASKFFVFKK
ncbi:MAG: GtrA family protein [Candidatus Nealsonbacteria bacterium]|nr:GtrA family protein [Candidatus Nealsonbacteria bacterium]